jgi:hypothetical protein
MESLHAEFVRDHHVVKLAPRRGLAPYDGYYQYSSYGSPDQQPMGPAMVYPNQPQTNQPQTNQPQRSGCSTQTYSVPSESGGQRPVKIVTC